MKELGTKTPILFIAKICISLVLALSTRNAWAAEEAPVVALTEKGKALEAQYAGQLEKLKAAIKQAMPTPSEAQKAAYLKAQQDERAAEEEVKAAQKKLGGVKKGDESKLKQELEATQAAHAKAKAIAIAAGEAFGLASFLASDKLDAQMAKYVVLFEATPRGLAEFAQQREEYEKSVEALLGNPALMLQMVVADGAQAKPKKGGYGPAGYGQAMKIYADIQRTSDKAAGGILQRLALAVSLEYALQITKESSEDVIDDPIDAPSNAPSDTRETIDPVKRYLQYEKAYLGGDLDPGFNSLSVWDFRMVVDGGEKDEAFVWGREMLRDYRPDFIHAADDSWRYVRIVSTGVPYGSRNVKYDRPDLQDVQNILMNGGICGRRAGFGRFILRAFGIPTIARPSRKHAALARWTPKGWVVCLGPGWGKGWTATPYGSDLDFLASTQARSSSEAYMKVKRAYWVGDAMGEKRTFGLHEKGTPAFWNSVALYTQQMIIQDAKAVALDAFGAEFGEADAPMITEKLLDSDVKPEDRKISYGEDGVITIPAAAYSNPSGETRELVTMKSFAGGLQILLEGFGRNGQRVLRGGAWKSGADGCTSGGRLRSGGFGRYSDWGFRAAVTHTGSEAPRELTLDLGGGVTMEFVYIKPGTFTMGGESTKEGRFQCVEVPRHKVTLTRGFYLGKYEVTQAQFQAIMGVNCCGSTKAPNCPVDTIHEEDAARFCDTLAQKTGRDVRLPTEAEWEYACRAGSDTRWFFGDDPSRLEEYAWVKDNAGGASHPVGQKKPNPWGLYDMYGNVCERVDDAYVQNYYANSPEMDPAGPAQEGRHFEYKINAPRPGKYSLTARVATPTVQQKLMVSANGAKSEVTIRIPFTLGKWHDCEPVTLTLKDGENTLRFSRLPPQRGMAIKSFTLKPVP